MRKSLIDWCIENDAEYILKEWDEESNGNLDKKLSFGSRKKVNWKCEKGHVWSKSISQRTLQKSKCPYCSNRKVLKGYNDFLSKYPAVAKEWDYEKNENIKPDDVVYGSNKKVWWKCLKCAHSWKAAVYARTINKSKCPKCEMELKKTRPFYVEIPEENESLEKLCPELMKEWAYDLNAGLLPRQLKKGSGKKVWWRCEKGHVWQCSVEQRTKKKGTKCPICQQSYHVSFPEKAIAYYLEKQTIQIYSNYRPDFLGGKELDIFLPDYKIGIEYDGEFAHKKVERDIEKDRLCSNKDIFLIHIRQKGCPQITSSKMLYYQLENNENQALTEGIKFVFEYLGVQPSFVIDVERDKSVIYEYMDIQEKKDSLQEKQPQIAQEWNYEKNGYLRPVHISVHSNQKVWWKCSKCHNRYQKVVNQKIRYPKCPFCKQ